MTTSVRALELYCGIGGFAAAAADFPIEVVAAFDASQHVVEAYNLNWAPVAKQTNLLSLSPRDFAALEADLWWMSPPCAPYTRRGNRLDLDDHRAASFLRVIEGLREARPPMVALENVEGFAESAARDLLVRTLDGYSITEVVLCPTVLGVPNKRPRYYLAASRVGAVGPVEPDLVELADWRDFVLSGEGEGLTVPPDIASKYGDGFHVMTDDERYTTCFTGSYGKSWNFTGSYVPLGEGRLRQFSPREVLRFLGFGDSFRFPDSLTTRQRHRYAGNSLSVPAVREILRALFPSGNAGGR